MIRFFFAASFLILLFVGQQLSGQQSLASKGVANLTVKVTTFSGAPRTREVVVVENKALAKKYLDTTDAQGLTFFSLSRGVSYLISLKTIAKTVDFKALDIPAGSEPMNVTYNLQFENKVFTLENIFFDSGKSVLKPESFKAINELAEYLKLKKTVVIELSGHTDNVGDATLNQKLSQDRAESVRAYLIQKGIAANRVEVKGYGDTLPVADNSTDEGKQKNRRTEIKIIKE